MSDTGSLLLSMLAVQSEAPTLMKDSKATVRSDKGSYTYSYIGLDTVVEKIGPLLHQNQLVWTTKPSYIEGVGPSLKYKLAHATTKEYEEGEMLLLLPKNDPQGQGSAITYARRYALCAVLNLVADDDDDGARAAAKQANRTGPALASDAQKKRLRADITRNAMGADTVDALFKGAGFARHEGEKVNDAINRLTGAQASSIIDFVSRGALPTGVSDVPGAADGEFTHPPAPDGGMFPPVEGGA